jgi:hypothetical protein
MERRSITASRKVTFSDRRTVLDAKLVEGRNLLATTPHGIKLFATVKQNKIQSFSANDKTGNRVRVTMLRSNEGGGRKVCWVCIDTPSGRFCYQIDCHLLPFSRSQ